jgi:hypothetical protein
MGDEKLLRNTENGNHLHMARIDLLLNKLMAQKWNKKMM